jgi:FkbM family methyltransferase
MHIGSFCFAALLRRCAHVYGFEAERENYNLAVRNLQRFGKRVHLYHKAVWRSDRTSDALYSGNGYAQGNTGGGCILYETQGEKLDLIAFDEIIQEVTNHGRKRIRLVKIDCEGSEFPILMTSRLLHLIDQIHGEYHHGVVAPAARVDGVAELTIEALTEHLQAAGFRVKSFPTPNGHLGLFFANRG